MTRHFMATLLWTLVVCAAPAQSQTDADGFRPLFNGKDLTGWVPVNTAPSTWSVKDGMIHCTGKPIGEMRTDRMYQNFILEVEWRHLKPKGNAGIFIWADDITAKGQPFHRGIEVQVLENAYGKGNWFTTHGDIFPIHGAKMKPINGRKGSRAFPTEQRSKPSPNWNHYRIECIDGKISLAVNGKVVTRGTDCSPKKGYICLESEGGIVDYRNLRIKELPDTPIDPQDVAIADRGYKSLYTGVDLSGWKAGAKGWQASDWNLKYSGSGGAEGTLVSEKSFGDYGFIFDLRRTDKSKATRVLLRGTDASAVVIDPAEAAFAKLGKGWSRFEGELRGDRLTLRVNGREVYQGKALAGTPASGPLAIAPEGPTTFANIYVRPLK